MAVSRLAANSASELAPRFARAPQAIGRVNSGNHFQGGTRSWLVRRRTADRGGRGHSTSRNPAKQGAVQFVWVYWFREVVVHTCFETLFTVASHGVGRHGNDWQ